MLEVKILINDSYCMQVIVVKREMLEAFITSEPNRLFPLVNFQLARNAMMKDIVGGKSNNGSLNRLHCLTRLSNYLP